MHAQHVQGLCASQGPSALFLAGVCLYSALPTVLLPTAHTVLPTDDTRASCGGESVQGKGFRHDCQNRSDPNASAPAI